MCRAPGEARLIRKAPAGQIQRDDAAALRQRRQYGGEKRAGIAAVV